MTRKEFKIYAEKRVPKGKHLVAIDFHCFENRYVGVLADLGNTYPFTGRIYEPKNSVDKNGK